MITNTIEERKKKFLLFLPLVVLPFVTLLFYSIGGGRGPQNTAPPPAAGFNPVLPSPQLDKQDGVDKLSLYKKEDRYALEQGRRSTDSNPSPFEETADTTRPVDSRAPGRPSGYRPAATESPYSPGSYGAAATKRRSSGDVRSSEEKINERLKNLQALLDSKVTDSAAGNPPPETAQTETDQQIAALQNMMKENTGQLSTQDPQLKQMEGMLDKILAIQHPEKLNEKPVTDLAKGKVYAVSSDAPVPENDLLAGPNNKADTSRYRVFHLTSQRANTFFDDENDQGPKKSNAISAVIHEGKTVSNGATIKIRLTQDMYVQGLLVPKGNLVFGRCNITGDRLMVEIASIFFEGNFYPVNLSVFDTHGMQGLSTDAGMEVQAAKEGTDQAMQALSIGTMNESLGAQATMAGIEAAKRLIGRKVKVVKVTLKADCPILLVESKKG
ncbi:conjugative transposon protein TraM [Chitinophaga sp. CC14]|uniref:conjugative transposon protein TraM n=1 Tax=Chitinophaga sp. CC14 TaxID=3029199 RepID=UPI003B7E2626